MSDLADLNDAIAAASDRERVGALTALCSAADLPDTDPAAAAVLEQLAEEMLAPVPHGYSEHLVAVVADQLLEAAAVVEWLERSVDVPLALALAHELAAAIADGDGAEDEVLNPSLRPHEYVCKVGWLVHCGPCWCDGWPVQAAVEAEAVEGVWVGVDDWLIANGHYSPRLKVGLLDEEEVKVAA
jgi:hypothetical protein